MATVTETDRPFDATLERTWMRVDLRDDRDEAGELLVPGDRLYYEKQTQKLRTDSLKLKYPNKTLRIDDTLDTFDPGDAATLIGLLLKMYNATSNVE